MAGKKAKSREKVQAGGRITVNELSLTGFAPRSFNLFVFFAGETMMAASKDEEVANGLQVGYS